MIVHLSGDKWINTERICSISKEGRVRTEASDAIVYIVAFDSTRMTLSQTQGEELLGAIKDEMHVRDAEMWRKRDEAEATLIGQMGRERWISMDDDAQYDAVTDEVARQGAMATHINAEVTH